MTRLTAAASARQSSSAGALSRTATVAADETRSSASPAQTKTAVGEEQRRRRPCGEGDSRRAEHERADVDGQRDRGEERCGDRSRDERRDEGAAPAAGRNASGGEQCDETGDRGGGEDGIPAGCDGRGRVRVARDRAVPLRPARRAGRPPSTRAGAPRQRFPSASATPARRRSVRSRSAISAAPWAASTDAASGCVSGRTAAAIAYVTQRQPPPRSSAATNSSVATTIPRRPSA